MLSDAIVDVDSVAEQAAAAARVNAEQRQQRAQRLVGQLREVYEQIIKEEDLEKALDALTPEE